MTIGYREEIRFTPDPPERTPIPGRERIMKFTTPNGDGYLSFILLHDGRLNISMFLCDDTVVVNTTQGLVPANVLNATLSDDCEEQES